MIALNFICLAFKYIMQLIRHHIIFASMFNGFKSHVWQLEDIVLETLVMDVLVHLSPLIIMERHIASNEKGKTHFKTQLI